MYTFQTGFYNDVYDRHQAMRHYHSEDKLDRELINLIIANGHQSNRDELLKNLKKLLKQECETSNHLAQEFGKREVYGVLFR